MIVRFLIFDQSFLKEYDYFTPIIYLFLIYFQYFNITHEIGEINYNNEIVIIRLKYIGIDNDIIKFIYLSVLILFGHRTLFVFGNGGWLLSFFITTISFLYLIHCTTTYVWKEYSNYSKFKSEDFQPLLTFSTIALLLIFISWKGLFCYGIGIKEIGHYFEKDNHYEEKTIEIYRSSNYEPINVTAAFYVSDVPSENNFSSSVFLRITPFKKPRYIKLIGVKFENGKLLEFKNCLFPYKNEYQTFCTDVENNEWIIEFPKN